MWSGPRLAFHRRPGAAFYGADQRSRDIAHVLGQFLTGCASENVPWNAALIATTTGAWNRDSPTPREEARDSRGSGRASRHRGPDALPHRGRPRQPDLGDGPRHRLGPGCLDLPAGEALREARIGPPAARRNVTEMRLRGAGTPRNRAEGNGMPIRAKTDDLALRRAMPGTPRNRSECARRESNPRPSA